MVAGILFAPPEAKAGLRPWILGSTLALSMLLGFVLILEFGGGPYGFGWEKGFMELFFPPDSS